MNEGGAEMIVAIPDLDGSGALVAARFGDEVRVTIMWYGEKEGSRIFISPECAMDLGQALCLMAQEAPKEE